MKQNICRQKPMILICDKDALIIREKTGVRTNGAGETEYLLVCEWNQNLISHPGTNINSKWIKDLNIRPEPLKLVEDKVYKTRGTATTF